MKRLHFSPEMSVPDALQVSASMPRLFGGRRTACVGCPVARFCTLRDVARIYEFSLEPFLAELEQALLADTSDSDQRRAQ
jgi:hypothetical protein